MRLVLTISVIFSILSIGCAMANSTELVGDPGGVNLNVSINPGPVANDATIQIVLNSLSGYKAGSIVEVLSPDEEIRSYLKALRPPMEIHIGETKKLSLDEPKSFVLYIRSAKQIQKHLYLLDKNASLSINVPCIVLMNIRLIIEVENTKLCVPPFTETRSIVQIDLNNIDHIIKINNSPVGPP